MTRPEDPFFRTHMAPEPAPSGGTSAQLPRDPGAAFSRMRDAFERDTKAKGQADREQDVREGGEEPPLLPGIIQLVRTASRCADEHAADYLARRRPEHSQAPASFMASVGMLLATAADVLDEMVHVDEESRRE